MAAVLRFQELFSGGTQAWRMAPEPVRSLANLRHILDNFTFSDEALNTAAVILVLRL